MDENFTRKGKFGAGGHKTNTPASIPYSSAIARDAVKITFMIATLNYLDIISCNIGNAYSNAQCPEII